MIMERAIGEIFDFNDVKLKVKDTCREACCDGCYFDESEHECFDAYISGCIGVCSRLFRSDGKNVIFVEVENDQNKEDKL